jgi:hypothetical protein
MMAHEILNRIKSPAVGQDEAHEIAYGACKSYSDPAACRSLGYEAGWGTMHRYVFGDGSILMHDGRGWQASPPSL